MFIVTLTHLYTESKTHDGVTIHRDLQGTCFTSTGTTITQALHDLKGKLPSPVKHFNVGNGSDNGRVDITLEGQRESSLTTTKHLPCFTVKHERYIGHIYRLAAVGNVSKILQEELTQQAMHGECNIKAVSVLH